MFKYMYDLIRPFSPFICVCQNKLPIAFVGLTKDMGILPLQVIINCCRKER